MKVRTMLARMFPGAAIWISRSRDLLMLRLFGQVAGPTDPAQPARVADPRARWLKIGIALLAVTFYGYLFYQAVKTWDSQVLQSVRFEPIWIVGASLVQILGYIWAVHLRQRMLAWLGYPLPFIEHQKIYAYSDLAAKLPGIFWGYASRIYLYHRFGVARSVAGVAIGLEIITTGVASSLVALITILISPSADTFVPLPVLIGALAVCAICTHPLVLRLLLRRFANQPLADALDQLSWGAMLYMIVCYSVIIAMGGVCMLGIASATVGARPDLLVMMIETWSLTVVWGVIIAWLPVEFGLRQGPLLVILSTIFPIPIVAVMLLVWRIWINAIELMWGAVALGLTLLVPAQQEAGQHHD